MLCLSALEVVVVLVEEGVVDEVVEVAVEEVEDPLVLHSEAEAVVEAEDLVKRTN